MQDLFLQCDQEFGNIAHSLEQRFRRSYRASEQEIVTGYKDLEIAEGYLKQMEISLQSVQDLNEKNNFKNMVFKRKSEYQELKKRFQAYQQIIKDNQQRGNIKLSTYEELEQRQQKSDLLAQNGNHKLIDIKYQAYNAERTAIETQQQIKIQNGQLDKMIGGQQDQNRLLSIAEKEADEIQRRRKNNKLILQATLYTVFFVLISILCYRLYKLFK